MKRSERHTPYEKGSTDFHTAVPPRTSDGRPGGVPLEINAPSPRKPAVLATIDPDPSQGTPCTAIRAVLSYLGAASARFRRRSGGTALFEQLLMLTITIMTRYLRLMVRGIAVCRMALFHNTALPIGSMNRFVHDRRHALFRRRAVHLDSSHSPLPLPPCGRPSPVGGMPVQPDAAWASRDTVKVGYRPTFFH